MSGTEINVNLKVRQIIAAICAPLEIDAIFSDSTLDSCGFDLTDYFVFWEEVEEEFDVHVTQAERESLNGRLVTVAQIVNYLKQRIRESA